MSENKQLIVGIDPGTTTGVAVLDLDGNLILTKSKKNFSRADINTLISNTGQPLIIASDISNPPKLLEKISASLPTRLMSPKTIMSKKEKNEIVKLYKEKVNEKGKKLWSNTHEKDALASALFAWVQLRSLIERIKKKLDRNDILEDEIRNYVMSNVLLRKNSIKTSIEQYPEEVFNYKTARIK